MLRSESEPRPTLSQESESIDGAQILRRLREADETTLRFNSWGFGGRLEPEESATYLTDLLSHATLAHVVPEDVRLSYDRVRNVFMHGLLDYDLFSAAYSLGHMVLEGALRARFISYYPNGLPIRRNGVSDLLTVRGFAEYYDWLVSQKRRDKLQLDTEPPEPLPRGYSALYEWARRRELLVGQRNVGVFGSIVTARNHLAHPEGHAVDMPPGVFRFLRDLSEIVNRLWGVDTQGGRLFPGPVSRWARAAAVAPDGDASLTFGSLPQVRDESHHQGWNYCVYLAAREEELVTIGGPHRSGAGFAHLPGFQTTAYPMELLWGPGAGPELVASLAEFSDQHPMDEVQFLDRTFYIRQVNGGAIEFPRDRRDVLAAELDDASATWFVVCADFPMDAFGIVRDLQHNPASQPASKAIVAHLSGDRAARAHAGG
jgi:hypothetical protein